MGGGRPREAPRGPGGRAAGRRLCAADLQASAPGAQLKRLVAVPRMKDPTGALDFSRPRPYDAGSQTPVLTLQLRALTMKGKISGHGVGPDPSVV